MKISRKQVREGLEQVPIETVLMGAGSKHGVKLTAKEKRFAEEVLKGSTKSEAFRRAYNTKAKPSTVAREAYAVSTRPHVKVYMEAQEQALEAERLRTPAALRSLAINELTKHALNESFPPAQRVKCLELLGKITEVALFTERREVVKVDDTQAARAKLLDSIKSAIKLDAIDAKLIEGDELLRELARATPEENTGDATPPAGDPPEPRETISPPLHSNPHIESCDLAEKSLPTQSIVDSQITEIDSDTCPDSHHNICYGENSEQNQ